MSPRKVSPRADNDDDDDDIDDYDDSDDDDDVGKGVYHAPKRKPKENASLLIKIVKGMTEPDKPGTKLRGSFLFFSFLFFLFLANVKSATVNFVAALQCAEVAARKILRAFSCGVKWRFDRPTVCPLD